MREMGSKFNPWRPRVEVIQANESYEAKIPFEAQKAKKKEGDGILNARLLRDHKNHVMNCIEISLSIGLS